MLKSINMYPLYSLAKAVERKRGGTTLYTDDGSNYWPMNAISRVIGVNFTIREIDLDASDTIRDLEIV